MQRERFAIETTDSGATMEGYFHNDGSVSLPGIPKALGRAYTQTYYPEGLRQLAAALLKLADVCEARKAASETVLGGGHYRITIGDEG